MEEINKHKIVTHNVLKVGSKNLNTENWKVYHPNGKHMFTCGERKANWYLDKNLAKIIGKHKIELTFSPKGNGFEDNEVFGRSIRETRCVVSGINDNLQRHHIVPYCYRTYFPEAYKSKNHHDVVLINHDKHAEYEQFANKYKDEIACIYGVKTISELNTDYTFALRQFSKPTAIILSTIHSIFKTYGRITDEMKLEKLKYVADNTNLSFEFVCKLNYVQLYKLYLDLKNEHEKNVAEFKENNRILFDHGYQVVNKLDSEEKIVEFVKLWRQHFIDTMQPQYMPHGWSVDFRIKTNIL